SGSDGTAGVATRAAGHAAATPTLSKARPPRGSSRGASLQPRHAGVPAGAGEEERLVEVDRATARRALLNSAARRESGGGGSSDGSYSSGAGEGGTTGERRLADGRSRSGSGGSGSGTSGGAMSGTPLTGRDSGGGAGGLSPAEGRGGSSRLAAPTSRASELKGEKSAGGGFFSFPSGAAGAMREGGGGRGGSGGEMVSPLRSPMPRGERTGEPGATTTRGGERSRPPAAAAAVAVATEETFNPTLGSSRTWSFLSGLAASSAQGSATNGVSAAGSNGVPRATNGVSETSSNHGAPRATNGVGGSTHSDNGVGTRARSMTTSDSESSSNALGGFRTGSPVGQM
ncbi:unnamed protein product, partial [Hapterophycus canaliculatus]